MSSSSWKIFAAIIVVAALSACTSEETDKNLNSAWIGQNVDDFFMKHGAPSGEYNKTDGGKIFTWTGGERTTNAGIVVGTTYVPHEVKMSCSVQVATNHNGIINQIKILKDTSGMWQLSRCAEILK